MMTPTMMQAEMARIKDEIVRLVYEFQKANPEYRPLDVSADTAAYFAVQLGLNPGKDGHMWSLIEHMESYAAPVEA